jgi:hypothetical protein
MAVRTASSVRRSTATASVRSATTAARTASSAAAVATAWRRVRACWRRIRAGRRCGIRAAWRRVAGVTAPLGRLVRPAVSGIARTIRVDGPAARSVVVGATGTGPRGAIGMIDGPIIRPRTAEPLRGAALIGRVALSFPTTRVIRATARIVSARGGWAILRQLVLPRVNSAARGGTIARVIRREVPRSQVAGIHGLDSQMRSRSTWSCACLYGAILDR